MPNAKAHLRYHTENYERWAFTRISKFSNETSFRGALNMTGRLLQDGNVPAEVGLPPDPDWDGTQ